MKSTETAQEFISAQSRGGLVFPTADLVGILEVTELSFRSEVSNAKDILRNIQTDLICTKVFVGEYHMSSGIDILSPTQKLCLENVVKLYLRVRSFSYVCDFITQYKITQKKQRARHYENN